MAAPGQYLASYRLLNIVGNGRTCQVWEAMVDGRPERYAVKLIVPSHRKDWTQIGLMKHEFAVGQKLQHPQVIRFVEFDMSRQTPFLAMEYFGPANLKQLIVAGVEQIAAKAAKIIEQAAAGLWYFHQQSWIHRDIKPNNFLVNAEGDVKLIDFALAEKRRGFFGRLFGGRAKIQGTRSYMSPEQIRRQSLDVRADIYSFGCVMYETICGKPPFTANSENELLNKHLKSPPPSLEAGNRYVTYECNQLVRRMLAKNPDDRPESMEEVLRDLRAGRVFRLLPTARKE